MSVTLIFFCQCNSITFVIGRAKYVILSLIIKFCSVFSILNSLFASKIPIFAVT